MKFSPAIGRSVETYSNVKSRETGVKLEHKDFLETDFVTCKWELNERKFGLNRSEEDARNVGIYGDLDFTSPVTQAGAAADDDQKDQARIYEVSGLIIYLTHNFQVFIFMLNAGC